MLRIDINCDVGEGLHNEALLMPYISSCNIACTAHAGSIESIDRVIQLAKQQGVKVGAHPSFPDRVNFGRRVINITPEKLEKSIIEQIELLNQRLELADQSLHHIKMHGALYNLSAKDIPTAEIVLKAVKKSAPNTILYAPDNSQIVRLAESQGIKIKREAFADRNYNEDLSLVSRKQNNALITDKDQAFKHLSTMIFQGSVETVSGIIKPLKAETFCVHGDNSNAIELVAYIHKNLLNQGIHIG